jgi:nuclease S1
MKTTSCLAAAFVAFFASPALAWGDLGHEVIAKIAYAHLTPAARAKVDALLASDPDKLTESDFASRATWADKYRSGHRETAEWHYVDAELDRPDLDAACFNNPKLAPGQPASAGPEHDCVVDKIDEFAAELRNPVTPVAERLLAFKFLLHFVGDLHQPLHAADHRDRGGNCIGLSPSPDGHAKNLHGFWDSTVVYALGRNPDEIAAKLNAQIKPSEAKTWSAGTARDWAREGFQIARRDVYALPDRPTCDDHRTISLSQAYITAAERDAEIQLEKAGVRLAYVLNASL